MVPRLDADALVDALALHVPAGRVPLRAARRRERRARLPRPEFELVDTGVFDDGRYWEITVDYAKASPEDILVRVSVRNAGPRHGDDRRAPHALVPQHVVVGRRRRRSRRSGSSAARSSPTTTASASATSPPPATPRRSSARTRRTARASSASPPTTPYPKDGIGDHVIHGAPTVNPDQTGTKAAFRYRLEVAPGETATLELRLAEKRRPRQRLRLA